MRWPALARASHRDMRALCTIIVAKGIVRAIYPPSSVATHDPVSPPLDRTRPTGWASPDRRPTNSMDGKFLAGYMVSVIFRLQEVDMGRVWRQQAGTLLIMFIVLAAVTMVYGIIRNAGQHIISGILLWLVVYTYLAWRIWRHRSSRARDALLVLSALGVFGLIRVVFHWSPDLLVASGLCTAQFVLLLSPAIRRHVQAEPSVSRPSND